MIIKKFYFNLILFFIIIFIITLKTEAIIIDSILAKVNNEIITQSELEEQLDDLRDELLQNYKPEEVEKVLSKQRIELLGKLIETKILMQEAKKLNVTLTDEEVDKEVNKNFEQIKGHFASEEKFLDTLQQKGINPDFLKEKIQKSVRENMLIQRLVFRAVRSQVDVTESEIREYFLHTGEETHARHILIKILPDANSEEEKKAREKADSIYKELINGSDFKELAKKYSEDVRASEGGDLGFFKRGDMIPEFEDVLSKLKVGEFCEPLRTRYGLHIIFVEERKMLPREEEVRASHILLKSEEDAINIKKQLKDGANFENLAREKSEDASSREKGGDLGYFKKNMMIEGFGEVAFSLKQGEISDPVKTKFGYHIVKVLDRRYVQFNDLHEDIKNALLQSRMESRYIHWLYNLRKNAAIEVNK